TNQFGSTTITLIVTSGGRHTSTTRDLSSDVCSSDLPTISSVANQSTDEDTPTAAIPFSIGDVETPAGNLMVSGRSSNPVLVPDEIGRASCRERGCMVPVAVASIKLGCSSIALTGNNG